MSNPHTQLESVHSGRGQPWWWPAPAIIAAGAALSAVVQCTEFQFTGRPTVDLAVVVWISEVALFSWLMFFSQISPIRRVVLLVLAVATIVVASLMTFADGFTGDGRPILSWRFARPKIATIAHLPAESLNQTSTSLPRSIDLTQTGPADSPQFRGPDRSGVYHGVRLSRDWSRTPPRLLWRHPIGIGWSSFAVVGRWGVTQEQRGEEEAVVCYDAKTGDELWEHLDRGLFHEVMGGDGPRATPTIDDGRVYALGATGTLNCLDGASGRPIWTRQILEDARCSNRPFGMVGSPLVLGDVVVVCPGGRLHSLVAYDRESGAFRWGAGESPAAYSSPVATTLAGIEQILIFNADGLFAHDAHDGRVLWSESWVTPPELNNVCQPVPVPATSLADLDRVFLASGYDKGCGLLEVNRTADALHVATQWANRHLRPKFSSVVVRDGFVYGLDERILTCLDLETGAPQWKGGRFGYGQLILADGLLLIQAESGEVALVEATPESFHELGRFAALDHRTWTHPVLAGRFLLVRNDREAACYELTLEESGR